MKTIENLGPKRSFFNTKLSPTDDFVLSFEEEIEFLTLRAPRISPKWYQFTALEVSSKLVGHFEFAPSRFEKKKIQFDTHLVGGTGVHSIKRRRKKDMPGLQ